MFTLLRSLLQRLEVNRAVGYLLLARGWQFASGIVSVLLLTSCLSPEQRDLYYLFGSLIGMQMFVELGLPTILVLLTSHEWSQLCLDEAGCVQGHPEALARVANLQRAMGRWFTIGALVFAGVVLARGYLKMQDTTSVNWQGPWIALVLITAAAIPFVPKFAMLEGGQQVAVINRVRLSQSVVGSLAVWGVLLAGGGLWSLVASGLVRWGWEYSLVQVRYRATFASLRNHVTSGSQTLREEVWPLAWRIALQTIGTYFGSLYLTQIVDDQETVGETGRWGMTWQVLSALQTAALAWVNTRSPEFGILAAQGQHGELRRRMWRTGGISLIVYACGAASFLAGLRGLQWVSPRHAGSFLSISEAAVMSVGFAALLMTVLLHSLVRYDKRDPFLAPHTISSAGTVTLAWWCGQQYGVTGVVMAFAGVAGLFTLPIAIGIAIQHARRR